MDLLKSIAYPEEVYALLKYKIGKAPVNSQHAIRQLVCVSPYHTKPQVYYISVNNDVLSVSAGCIVNCSYDEGSS